MWQNLHYVRLKKWTQLGKQSLVSEHCSFSRFDWGTWGNQLAQLVKNLVFLQRGEFETLDDRCQCKCCAFSLTEICTLWLFCFYWLIDLCCLCCLYCLCCLCCLLFVCVLFLVERTITTHFNFSNHNLKVFHFN